MHSSPHTHPPRLPADGCQQLLGHGLGLQQAAECGERCACCAGRCAAQGHQRRAQPAERAHGAGVEPLHAQGELLFNACWHVCKRAHVLVLVLAAASRQAFTLLPAPGPGQLLPHPTTNRCATHHPTTLPRARRRST